MSPFIDLVIAMKSPQVGKSRLRGAFSDPTDQQKHEAMVLALAEDTLTAVRAVPAVRRVLVVAVNPPELAVLADLGAEIVPEPAAAGLNGALRHGETLLRSDNEDGIIGALQPDLAALRSEDLAAALAEANGRRAFVADRDTTGTTLLLSAPGMALDPRFGQGSAQAHTDSGAFALTAPLLSLRSDVDNAADLEHAKALGLGKRTSEVLGITCSVG